MRFGCMESHAGKLWRERARRLRVTAELIKNPMTRDSLLREAADYEVRAQEADERAETAARRSGQDKRPG
jgi:hypothetical protein